MGQLTYPSIWFGLDDQRDIKGKRKRNKMKMNIDNKNGLLLAVHQIGEQEDGDGSFG